MHTCFHAAADDCRRAFLYFLWIAVLPLLAAVPIRAAALETLSFGIVPQQSATKLARNWVPILRWLSDRSGLKLRFATAKDIPTFEQRLQQGQYDVAYMNPYDYTLFSRAPGYRAFAKQKEARIQGIIVVRKDSPYRDMQALIGQKLAFPAPAAFAASLLPRAQLAQAGIEVQADYVASHDSVYRAVAQGLYPAGGGIMRTLDSIDPSIGNQLRVLWKTGAYTPHALAAHPRIPADDVARLQRAMVGMRSDPRGAELLREIRFAGLEAAEDAEWDDVRALRLDSLMGAGPKEAR